MIRSPRTLIILTVCCATVCLIGVWAAATYGSDEFGGLTDVLILVFVSFPTGLAAALALLRLTVMGLRASLARKPGPR